jgi:transposase
LTIPAPEKKLVSKEHPGIEIIFCDRGSDYIEGTGQGAPGAIQIADRFHLLQNVVDALKRMLEKQAKQLREAARQVASDMQAVVNQALEAEVTQAIGLEEKQPTLQELRFTEVKTLAIA